MLINFSSQLIKDKKVNPLVTRYKCFIASADTVANTYYFNKQVLENMKSTVVSSPVVAGFIDNEDGSLLGGHEHDLTKTEIGYKRTPSPIAVGYVLDIEPWWEEHDGKSFLTCFVHIWDYKYPGLANISERSIFQSMEIELESELDGQIRNVKNAMLTALCILENVQPAFAGSGFEKFSFQDYKQEVEQLKQEFEKFSQGGENENMFYGLTSDQLRRRIKIALSAFSYTCTSGEYEYNKYYLDDFSDNLAFVKDEEDDQFYSISYQFIEGKVVLDISSKTLVEEGYKPITFSEHKKIETFLQKDEYGTGEKIEFDLTKESASNDSWGNVNKTTLRNQIAKSSNWQSAKSKCYIVSEGDNASDWKYPVCQIKDNKLVYNINGVQASWSMLAKETNESYYSSAKTELKKIYKKLGLSTDSFSRKGDKKKMADYKAMYKQMKDEQSAFALDDSDGIIVLIDEESQCIYVIDDNQVSKIPFDTDDADEFSVQEDKAEMCDGKEVMSRMSKMTKGEKEKMSAKMSEKDAEIGKAFASTTSLEAAMAESKKAIVEKEEEIKKLSEQLKEKETEQKKMKAEEIMSKKEFSVFSKEEKEELMKDIETMSVEAFENKIYSVFGKKVKDNIDFSSDTNKFSFMYTGNPSVPNDKESSDIYAEIRKKNE